MAVTAEGSSSSTSMSFFPSPPLAPLIKAQLDYLLTHSPHPIKINQVWSGCKASNYSDRISLLVPYCLEYLKWDVIYNAEYPMAAPDLIFPVEDEAFHPLHIIADTEGAREKTKSSLYEWNIKDTSRLLSLIHEMRIKYMLYQRKRISELDDARLKFEISTVLSREGIELCFVPGFDKPDEVKFAVPLDIDLNKLVHNCPWRHQQKIWLLVIFPVNQKYSSAPPAPRIKLVASSELKALFSIEDVKLPTWIDEMCIAEYLPPLEVNLKLQIVDAVASIGPRRRFIEALALTFGRPLEADPVFCRRATVLAVSGNFTFLVHFNLSSQFPKQPPVLTLQSSQHFDSQSTPVLSPPLTEYPWSPRWETSKMVERIHIFLMDECNNFKIYCSDARPLQ